ncbi:MAG: hypothetical protein C4582_10255, partial [Desulfobacteraceae bacterium]
ANVITDLQLERMLSPTGPTDGLVVSPLDGEVPKRIAILQGNPGGGDDHLLSSLILGANESILALNRTPDLEILLVSPLCQAFREKFLPQIQALSGLKILEAGITGVERTGQDGTLTVTMEKDGTPVKESVELAVILTKPKATAAPKL